MFKALAFSNIFASDSFLPARRRTFSQPVSRIRVAVSIILIALNAVVLVSYLFGVNSQSLNGYEMKKFQAQIAGLTEENKKFSVKASESSSITDLEQEYKNSNYVSVGHPLFLEVNQYTKR
jgi:hypothetical protein